MSKKTQFNTLEVQEEILSRSDVVIEDSSDTSDEEYEKSDSEEREKDHAKIDPVQE